MSTKTNIALAVPIILCAAAVPLANYAFAQSGDDHSVWGSDIMQSRGAYVESTVPRDPTDSAYQSNAYRYVPSPNWQPSNKRER
jgi:hypothetical protein